MRKRLFIQRRSERGQAFMELAISVVFLLILLSAVIDLGWAFYTIIALRDAAQEAASYGSMKPCIKDASGNNQFNNANIKLRLQQSATSPLKMSDISDSNIDIKVVNSAGTVITAPPYDYGQTVRVTVTVKHKIMTPFVGAFIGNNWEYPLTVTVSDTILQPKCGTN